jgi:hypothetical protein
MARVSIDAVPRLARPVEVDGAVAEAVALRDRAREASEAVAAAQANVDELERQDVETAAARARAGESLGAPAAGLRKAKDALALAQRDQTAIRLAQEQAETDVANTIAESAGRWSADLHDEAERARQAGRDAIDALRAACDRIGACGSARNWIDAGDYSRPPRAVGTASVAPSSRRRTANNEPLNIGELLAYAAELIDPPPPSPTAVLGSTLAEPVET